MQSVAQQGAQSLQFEFTGRHEEYFKIWLVNLCLILVTVGFYVPWAKVRTRRYFYGNTWLDGSAFEYTADPLVLLKGWMVAAGLFISYQLVQLFWPPIQLIVPFLMLPVVPWLLWRSLRFNHHHTRFRNVRFAFDSSYRRSLLDVGVMVILVVLTFGLAMPYMLYRQQRWLVGSSRYGQMPFQAHFTFMMVLRVYGLAMLVAILGGVSIGGLLFMGIIPPALTPIIPLPFYYLVYALFKSRFTNLIVNNSSLAEHRFESELKTGPYLVILLTNTLAILFTLGLAIPWARIRMARYRASCTHVLVHGSLDDFVQGQSDGRSAVGDQVSDVLDIELAI